LRRRARCGLCTRRLRGWCLITSTVTAFDATAHHAFCPAFTTTATFTATTPAIILDWSGLRNCGCAIDARLLPATPPLAPAFTAATAFATATPAFIAASYWRGNCTRIGLVLLLPITAAFAPAKFIAIGAAQQIITAIAAFLTATSIVMPTPTTMMAVTPAIAITATMLAIPIVPLPAPIAAMMIVHIVTAAKAIENEQAIAGIPIILVPAAAIAYVVETAAIVAVIIAIKLAVWIAIGIAIAIIIIAKANARVIIAGRKAHCRCTQCRDTRDQLNAKLRHASHPLYCAPICDYSLHRIRGTVHRKACNAILQLNSM
jgi:hypothetical protein